MKILAKILPFMLLLGLGLACNTVSKKQLEDVKVGDKLVYRYKKPDGKEWMYVDKITRIEGDKIYYVPGKMEATSKNELSLDNFVVDREGSLTKDELLKYTDETGDDHKVVIEIR
jgi:hypothetical protein